MSKIGTAMQHIAQQAPTEKSKLMTDYLGNVAPKIAQGKPLSVLDSAVKTAVECLQKSDEKGYQSANELIGRIMTKRT